ncbi:MAG: hypothetical protein ACI8TQ_001489 [Planctomycetota bacterium]|jgi:hypothetical protein
MKIHTTILPALVLGSALLLSTPRESQGYSTLGFNLAPGQSTFRVYNNFLDSAANNNTTPHDQFPGYTGAVMAIWKACVEWGSQAHGDGSGDPTQSVLGSGSSNFDPFFNGTATGVGIIGDNIHSSLNQSDGGTLAFMQGGSTGWWIRYLENWTWNDGPGSGGYPDLQAVACHEYGHALGLDHSTDSSATMYFSGGSSGARSINSDDIAGIQNIYGGKNQSGNKPTIATVTDLSGRVAITGTDFHATNNEVWFTRLTPGTTTSGKGPIKMTGIASTGGGTMIEVLVPPTAGPGDIMVRRGTGSASTTTQPFPFDPFSLPAPSSLISDVAPPRVPPMSPSGLSTVTLTGTGFTGATELQIDTKIVGDPALTFSGDWTIVSDTQIDVVLPLLNAKGDLDIFLTTTDGTINSSIFVDAPVSPVLLTEQPDIVSAVGVDFAMASAIGDVVALKVSGVLGSTILPGILDLEIGGGNLNSIFNVVSLSVGTKYWRKRYFGPFTGLPIGVDVHFEALVLPIDTNFEFPWDSTNVVTLTING